MLCALLVKSYVREHVRTLPSGRTITIPAYFTKVVPKPKDQPKGRTRGLKQEPPKGVRKPQTPEQLAHRLVRHVAEGSMTHEEALANILHLEERGKRGEGLTHAGGHQWTPEHLKEFGHHARTKLHAHLVERKQQQEKQVQEAREKLHRDMSRPLRRYEPVGSHYPGTKPFAVMETETGRHVTSEGYERRFATHEAADTWAQREHDKYWRQQEREGQQRLKQAKEQQRISIDVGTQSKAQRQDVAVESVQGGLAIQRALSTERSADGTYPQNQSDWHVVHIPTGKKLPVTTSRGGETLKKYQALAVQHALLALPIAWEKFVDPRTVTAEQKEHIRQVLSQMPPQRSPAAARKRDARIAATKE